MPLILPGNVASATASTTYTVANSCRFDGSNDYFTKTFGSDPTSTRIGTVSYWCKRSGFGASMAPGLTTSGNGSSYMTNLNSDDQIDFWFYYPGSGDYYEGELKTNAVFRDPSAWMHVFFSYDTTQVTNTNRLKLYINGTQVTSLATATYPDQNQDVYWGTQTAHRIGANPDTAAAKFNGYMAEVAYVDGVAHAITDFGEFDEDSPTIWKPKDISSGITWGTNGFYLDFEDSSALGDDVSGNNNDWTATGIAASDQSQDSPTNNFCTINPLDQAVGTFDISEGNLKYERTSDTTNWKSARGTIGIPNAGKWYWEMAKVGGSVDGGFGGIATDVADLTQEITGFWGFHDGGGGGNYTIHNGSYTDVGSSYNISDDDIIQIAFDRDNNKLWVGLNNSWGVNGGTPVTPSDPASGFLNISTNVLPAFMIRGTSQNVANFGQDSSFAGNITRQSNSDGNGYGDFYYTPPSGYLAVCTKNIGSDGG